MLKLALLLALFAPQEKLDPSKHPWAKWKPGTWVKYRITQQIGENKFEGTGTSTLSKVTDEEYLVSTKYDFSGQMMEEEESETIPMKDGEETLTIEGKEVECVIWKSNGKKGGTETEYRTWAAKEGSRLLKIVGKGGDVMDAVAVRMSESVEVGGKKYDCVRLEGSVSGKTGEGTAVFWTTEEIPGGWAKMEMKYPGKQEITVELEVLEYKTEK